MRVMTPLAREAYCLAWEGMSAIARVDDRQTVTKRRGRIICSSPPAVIIWMLRLLTVMVSLVNGKGAVDGRPKV